MQTKVRLRGGAAGRRCSQGDGVASDCVLAPDSCVPARRLFCPRMFDFGSFVWWKKRSRDEALQPEELEEASSPEPYLPAVDLQLLLYCVEAELRLSDSSSAGL